MAKTKIKALGNPRYLCCFGISPPPPSSSTSSSLPHKTTEESSIIGRSDEHKSLKQKSHRRWLSWENIIGVRVKSQSTKTVPLEGSKSDEKEKLMKLRSKGKANYKVNHSSKLRSKSNLHNRTNQHNTIPQPPSQIPPSHSQTPRQNSKLENNTCQKSRSSSTRGAATHAQTTAKAGKQDQNAKRSYNVVVGAFVVMATLLIMTL